MASGFRHSSHWQTLVSATLPTNTGPEGFRRGTFSINAVTTIRSDFGKRFTYEGTLGAGMTPSHGDLAEFQHSAFLMVSQGLRARVAGPLHLYTNVIYHSALYHDTGTTELDARELTIDLGGILQVSEGTRVDRRPHRGPGALGAGHRRLVQAGGALVKRNCSICSSRYCRDLGSRRFSA